jgi:SAM-dependent methyltransferase
METAEVGNGSPSNDDYRAEFYAQYDISVDMKAEPPSGEKLRMLARQFGGRWNSWLPSNPDARCVDVGCGTGEFLHYLRTRGLNNISGIDLSAGSLAVARQLGLQVELASAGTWFSSVEPGSLGMVSAFNFFEHLRKNEILELLPKIYRALAPGGRLLAVTPNGLSPFGGATRYWDFSHETGFTPASWRQLARISGFRKIDFEEYGPLPLSVFGIARSLLWRGVTLALVSVSYVEVGGPRDPSKVYTADMKIILQK